MASTKEQKLQKYMRRIIGTLVFTTALFGYLYSPYWLFGTMFIGLNLLQFSFTDWCLMQTILQKVVKD